jgi:F-type H+-transporting ATPase subunit b
MTNSVHVVSAAADALGAFARIPSNVTTVSEQMVLLTWVTFAIAFVLLYRIAWKPILRALERREQTIGGALKAAEQARGQAERIQADSARLLREAQARALEIAEESRRAAERVAALAEGEMRERSRRLLADAEAQIVRTREAAEGDVRRAGAGLAISLTERFLREEMSEAQRQALQQRAAEEAAAP